jgi:hypothetical protein
LVGSTLAIDVGESAGGIVDQSEGLNVSSSSSLEEGASVGMLLGTTVGRSDGLSEGGPDVGSYDGDSEGPKEGAGDSGDGSSEDGRRAGMAEAAIGANVVSTLDRCCANVTRNNSPLQAPQHPKKGAAALS